MSRECAWSATSQAAWIEITSAREGQGEGSISFRVIENPDPVGRRGAIAINEQRVDLSQEPAPCRFGVGPTPESFAAEGGRARVDVATHSSCRWSASSDASWLSVQPGSALGSGTVQLEFSPNSGPLRTTVVTIAGDRRSVTQVAAGTLPPAPNPPGGPNPPPPPSCTVDLSPSQRTFSAAGEASSVNVSTTSTCSWVATSNVSWITVLTASGTGSGTVDYVVQPNGSNQDRTGTITVRNAVHTVTQSGFSAKTVHLSGAVNSLSGSCPSLTFKVKDTVVSTDAQTEFRQVTCAGMRNGLEVDIDGFSRPDGSVLARRVELKN